MSPPLATCLGSKPPGAIFFKLHVYPLAAEIFCQSISLRIYIITWINQIIRKMSKYMHCDVCISAQNLPFSSNKATYMYVNMYFCGISIQLAIYSAFKTAGNASN